MAGDLVGEDGLLDYEEIRNSPVVITLAGAVLLITCAVGGWVLRRVLGHGGSVDRAFEKEYWRY